MGTRGFITFVENGAEKTAYNHWDSYPEGIGLKVLQWLRDAVNDLTQLKLDVGTLRVVYQDEPPSPEDIERLKKYADRNVSTGRPTEWYSLLRNTQGNPQKILEAGVIEDAYAFPQDSLFAEWGYVIDVDNGRFEVYRGFQVSPHEKGRFADRAGDNEYYPVALEEFWPFSALPSDDEFLARFEGKDD